MKNQTITLGSEVYVSDPCYTTDVWCMSKLTNVLPGKYQASMPGTYESWGERNTGIVVIHEDYVDKKKRWYHHGSIGVDSGQAGIFDAASYRNDEIAAGITSPEVGFSLGRGKIEDGDIWYEKMCGFTLSDKAWGLYDQGIVSRSGMGDGSYNFYVQKDKGKIVGISIDFAITPTQKAFMESLELV